MSDAPAAPKPEGGEDKQDTTITIRVRDQVRKCIFHIFGPPCNV